jgi:transposase-like protein
LPEDRRTLGDIRNETIISRGGPREKFSVNQPLVKVTYAEEQVPLTSKEQDIISELRDTLAELKSYDGLSIEQLKPFIKDKNSRFNKLEKQRIADISRAVRAGLIWHPLVSEFVYTQKALGNKTLLRTIKRGWETGVKRPVKLNDLQFINYLERIVQYREEGKTWQQIRRILMKRKIIKKMSWQALQKKFKKAWERQWKKVNKKAPPIP